MILVFDLGGPLVAYGVLRSAGIALLCSKLLPYVFVLSLSAWTLVYGEHEKKGRARRRQPAKHEHDSTSTSTSTGASPAPPGH